MFNQIIGGYTNLDTISSKPSQDAPFRGDTVKNGNILMQDDTIAPDYQPPDTKIKPYYRN